MSWMASEPMSSVSCATPPAWCEMKAPGPTSALSRCSAASLLQPFRVAFAGIASKTFEKLGQNEVRKPCEDPSGS